MVLERRPVRLEVPFEFRREAQRERAREGVMFRVAVPDPGAFVRREITEPLFVYGAGVCDTIQGPIAGGDAIVLCAAPRRKDPAVLWLTRPGTAPDALRGAALRAEYESATARMRAMPAAPPEGGAPAVKVRDLTALRRAVFRARAIPAAVPAEKPGKKPKKS
jgi:hypothetical protein